jgi:hypothetical protein
MTNKQLMRFVDVMSDMCAKCPEILYLFKEGDVKELIRKAIKENARINRARSPNTY